MYFGRNNVHEATSIGLFVIRVYLKTHQDVDYYCAKLIAGI